jgi:hypothetical protein
MSTQLPKRTSSGDPGAGVLPSEQTLRRICSEYIEMPGLRLTLQQAQRLWGLDEATCVSSLTFLVNAKFLARVDNHAYARVTDGAVPLPPLRMAKAEPNRSSRANDTQSGVARGRRFAG